jgi:hypothetical protein
MGKQGKLSLSVIMVLSVMLLALPCGATADPLDDSQFDGGLADGSQVNGGLVDDELVAGLDSELIIDEVRSTTGMAMTPGLILLLRGIVNYAKADDRSTLPWHSRLQFILALGSLLLLFFVKDFVPFEPLQKLLIAGEDNFMKILGLLAFFTVIPGLSEAVKPVVQEAVATIGPLISTGSAMAADSVQTVNHSFSQEVVSALPGFLATLVGVVIYIAVWLVSNTVIVLSFLAPGLAAPVLKGFKISLVIGMNALAAAHPLLGLAVALVIILVSFVVFGWAFRLMVWGTLFSFDLIFRRWRLPDSQDGTVKAFAGTLAAKTLKIPKRTLGRLWLNDGSPVFSYRRFLLFQREIPVAGPYVIGRTLTAPILAVNTGSGRFRELFFFRLRHRGHEQHLKILLSAQSIEILGLLGSSKKVWAWLKALFHRRPVEWSTSTADRPSSS